MIKDNIIAYTVFTPGVFPGIITQYSIRNCFGYDQFLDIITQYPTTNIAGDYFVIVPDYLDPKKISLTCRAYNSIGDNRLVTCNITPSPGGPAPTGLSRYWPLLTIIGITVNDNSGIPTEDFINCEVTIQRLPL